MVKHFYKLKLSPFFSTFYHEMPVTEEKSRSFGVAQSESEKQYYYGNFPEGFKFGTSTVAHQVEGTWDDDGKGLSMWDELSQSHPNKIIDRSTADQACNSYNKFESDVLLLKSMNSSIYNFSLNWSRILPDGTADRINEKGIDYYDDLINTLLENGIEPIVTIYHWDMPLALLQKYAGGWLNEGLISALESFAKICFERFGDRVKQFITIAHPFEHSINGYGNGVHPPNLSLGDKGALLSNTNLLKAHAKVYRMYESEFKAIQGGRVGISVGCNRDNDIDILQQLGFELYPLLHGEYPQQLTGATSGNCYKSQCVQLTSEWKLILKGAFDFIGLQFSPKSNLHQRVTNPELHIRENFLPEVHTGDISQPTMRSLLNIIKTEYKNAEVIVFCQGPPLVSTFQMMDVERAQYFNQIANQILKAIHLDGCNVTGYLPGKLMDCWEWEMGYTISYGLHHVDFQHPQQRRSPRASVTFMLKGLFKENGFQDVDMD